MTAAYISPHLSLVSTGGTQVAKANLHLLRTLLGDHVQAYVASRSPMPDVYPLATSKNSVGTAWANFHGLCGTLTPKGKDELLKDISIINPDLIWLDSSLFGAMLNDLRECAPNAKIITFFHNVEIDLLAQRIKRGALHYIPAWLATCWNEFCSVKKSDVTIAISNFDADRIGRIYKSFGIQIQPVCLKKPDGLKTSWMETDEVLFVGSEFRPNIEGINFLNEQVAPLLEKKRILIAGKGLEKHLTAPRHNNVDFLGFVDDLSPFYRRCRATLAPIFSGGGMKVKIAESFMHGRSVISSSFAAIGYEKSNNNSIFIANTAHEFAEAIEEWIPYDTGSAERDFDEHYSFEAGLRNLSQIINIA
jgi:hypothetical protein